MTTMPVATLARPEATDSSQIRIAVTDRGDAEQRDGIECLLSSEDAAIEWVTAQNVEEICDAIEYGKIDGLILTARGKGWQSARMLDQRLLTRSLNGSRSVPLLAIGDGMLELLQYIIGPDLIVDASDNADDHQVDFKEGTHLRRWACVDRMWVTADPHADATIPSDSDITINATTNRDGQQIVEGFEVRREALLMGTRFDPVELYLHPPTESIEARSRTIFGAWHIIKGFVEEVRSQAAN